MNDDSRQIAQAIIDRIDQAWEHDGMVPPDVLTADALYTNLRGQLFVGRQNIADGTRTVKEAFKTRVIKRELLETRRLGDRVIVALVDSIGLVDEGDSIREFPGRQLYVIVWDQDAWRVAAYQATMVTQPS